MAQDVAYGDTLSLKFFEFRIKTTGCPKKEPKMRCPLAPFSGRFTERLQQAMEE